MISFLLSRTGEHESSSFAAGHFCDQPFCLGAGGESQPLEAGKARAKAACFGATPSAIALDICSSAPSAHARGEQPI